MTTRTLAEILSHAKVNVTGLVVVPFKLSHDERQLVVRYLAEQFGIDLGLVRPRDVN